jgi:hypothetical protein
MTPRRIRFRCRSKETRIVIKKAIRTASATAILLIALCTIPGCYERTVRATGLGADQHDVSEPYQENSKVDDWLFGKKQETRRNGSLLDR